MSDLPAKRVLVVGLGRSGVPVARALAERDVEVVATDARADLDVDLPGGVEILLGTDGEDLVPLVAAVDLVVPSPGVAESAPVIRRALELEDAAERDEEIGRAHV